MRALLDANVLYPTIMREVLLRSAAAGLFEPRWSARILEEWARAAAGNLGAEGEVVARGEIAQIRAAWQVAEIAEQPGLEARLWLPDTADRHVLAAAIAGSCDVIVTMNARDFPRNILAEEGLSRADPDGLLLGFAEAAPEVIAEIGGAVLNEANRLSPAIWEIRGLMKKARLPRLGKWLNQRL